MAPCNSSVDQVDPPYLAANLKTAAYYGDGRKSLLTARCLLPWELVQAGQGSGG
jgi:hypothetical protein